MDKGEVIFSVRTKILLFMQIGAEISSLGVRGPSQGITCVKNI